MSQKAETLKENRIEGKQFQEIFEKLAKLQGLLALENRLEAFYIGPGQYKVRKSNLDYQLIHRDYGVAYVDCKSYSGDSFIYSVIDENQRKRAKLYNDWGVQSGFIVCFADHDRVVFFTGTQIEEKGERSSFHMDEGLYLGSRFNFALGNLFT